MRPPREPSTALGALALVVTLAGVGAILVPRTELSRWAHFLDHHRLEIAGGAAVLLLLAVMLTRWLSLKRPGRALRQLVGRRARFQLSRRPRLSPYPEKSEEPQVVVGSCDEDTQPTWVSLGEKELLKSLIITGGVGFGKTQLIFRCLDQLFAVREPRRMSFLILDPKGDMMEKVGELAKANGREEDLILIGSEHPARWNPLACSDVISQGRFRDVAERFKAAMINYQGGGSSDPFWIEAGTNLVGWLIWLVAMTLGDVTFGNLYKLLLLVSSPPKEGDDPLLKLLAEAERKVAILGGCEQKEQETNLETCRLYLEQDFRRVPDKTRMNIVANLSSFLQLFLTAEAQRLFSPSKSEVTIGGMSEAIEAGKILVLAMTQNERPGLCRAIGTFLKLSYQSAIMQRLAGGRKPDRLACLVLDEYQNFATSSAGETQFGDDRFFDQCRAAKGFGIIATQSYATLQNVFRRESAAQEILGQIGHKVTFATDEPSTCKYFRRLAGKHWIERTSRSWSESGGDARRRLFASGLTTDRASVGMSRTISELEVDRIRDEDIARLRPFEALAALKLVDGPVVTKLGTRPLFDPNPGGRFSKLATRLALAYLLLSATPVLSTSAPPNVCTALGTNSAAACLSLKRSSCTCRTPPPFSIPYPCTRYTYWVPKAYVEASPRIGESYFSMIPTVRAQLLAGVKAWNWGINKLGAGGLGFFNHGAVDDHGTSFFHVHTAPVLFSHEVFKGLPCGSPGVSLPCLSAMSEHHPLQWATGYFDLKQPQLHAGSTICGAGTELITGVAQSSRRFLQGPVSSALEAFGLESFPTPGGAGCSLPLAPTLGTVAVSREVPCLGSLGAIFPRYGAVNGPTSIAGALMAAYKFRSLAAEHFHTLPKGEEKWQLIRPKATSCFFPGENLATVEGLGMPPSRDRYLFLIWERRSCCRDPLRSVVGEAVLAAARSTCRALDQARW